MSAEMNPVGDEKFTADDEKQNNTRQDISVGLVQSEFSGNLSGSSGQENQQE
jgi:hypothetical protein